MWLIPVFEWSCCSIILLFAGVTPCQHKSVIGSSDDKISNANSEFGIHVFKDYSMACHHFSTNVKMSLIILQPSAVL